MTDAKPGTEGPPGTGVEGLAAAYRDRFPFKCVGKAPVWNRRAPRAGHWCVRSSESVDGFGGHSLTASAATVSPARGSKSGSPLGGEGAQGTGAKLA